MTDDYVIFVVVVMYIVILDDSRWNITLCMVEYRY